MGKSPIHVDGFLNKDLSFKWTWSKIRSFFKKNILRWRELANKTMPRGQYSKLTTLHIFFHNKRLESKSCVQSHITYISIYLTNSLLKKNTNSFWVTKTLSQNISMKIFGNAFHVVGYLLFVGASYFVLLFSLILHGMFLTP